MLAKIRQAGFIFTCKFTKNRHNTAFFKKRVRNLQTLLNLKVFTLLVFKLKSFHTSGFLNLNVFILLVF